MKDNESIMALQGYFNCTMWEVFDCPDINDKVVVSDYYIHFCVDSFTNQNINNPLE